MQFNDALDNPIVMIQPGICIVHGIVSVRVNHGQLLLKAGVFENRPTISLNKGTCGLTRLVILGHSGSVTLEALRWIHDINASITQIDYDSSVIMASVNPGPDVPRLRRAQALAPETIRGLELVKRLILNKISGQIEVCKRLGSIRKYVFQRIDSLIEQLKETSSFDQIRNIESQIAGIYWGRWSGVKVRFNSKDNARIPDEWKVFGTRISPLSNSPRKACTPANAILNYLYALLEAETRIACLTMGLDPGIGILHADQPYRDSMAYDLMEPVRPQVDSWLLDLIQSRKFLKRDFVEASSGQVRLTKHLAHEVAMTLPLWRDAIGPVVEMGASYLLDEPLPKRLTKTNKKRSISKAVGNKSRRSPKIDAAIVKPLSPALPFIESGPAALKRMRSENIDPAHGGKAGRKRGKSNKARSKERRTWEKSNSPETKSRELARFKNDIFPALAECSITQISRTTGLSPRYASLIRSGKVVPHPVHNAKLIKLINPTELKG